jgi:hypothetical protein
VAFLESRLKRLERLVLWSERVTQEQHLALGRKYGPYSYPRPPQIGHWPS